MDTNSVAEKKDYVEVPLGKYLGSVRKNPWVLSTVVLAVFLLVVLIFNFGSDSGDVVNADEAGANALSFIRSNPDLQGEVNLVSVNRQGSLYQAVLGYQGQEIPVYVTLDGQYLIAGEPVPITEDAGSVGSVPTEFVEASVDDDAVLGDENAPVTIIEFSDYQCPFCARFWSDTLPQLKSEYIETGKVKLVFRDFPLASLHPLAQMASEATECVRDMGGDEAFWKMHDKLFESQGSITEANIKLWAKDFGYDINACLSSGKFKGEVQNDLADGTAAGVEGTPAFVINGKRFDGALPFSQFKVAIDAELAAA